MAPIDAVREMVKDSGLSQSEVSRRMGRSTLYICSMLCTQKDVRAATLAEVAHVCGYRVVLIGDKGKQIELCEDGQSTSWASQNRR